jgi:hypothetical protein
MAALAQEVARSTPELKAAFERAFVEILAARGIQFFFSGMGARSSSTLERNSLRMGEVFALL